MFRETRTCLLYCIGAGTEAVPHALTETKRRTHIDVRMGALIGARIDALIGVHIDAHALTYALAHALAHSLAHALTYELVHAWTHSLAHALAHTDDAFSRLVRTDKATVKASSGDAVLHPGVGRRKFSIGNKTDVTLDDRYCDTRNSESRYMDTGQRLPMLHKLGPARSLEK